MRYHGFKGSPLAAWELLTAVALAIFAMGALSTARSQTATLPPASSGFAIIQQGNRV
ncbi:MAG: hypothetical protein L0Y60_00985 [Beijerinckiaceae bacterium]|nr:hypothetical protein [Beijerinckiaceae bacterium]